MYKFFFTKFHALFLQQVPATGIGLFRLLYGLVTLQEIAFLLYFNHLIFDPVPYIDIEFPMIPFFLCLWGLCAFFIVIGYHCQRALIASYLFWLVFVQFTPMQRDFDGGFDIFMTGAGFFLMFMPVDRAFAIDRLRLKLSTPFTHYRQYPKARVSALSYYLPVLICLGFLYFDSAIHKLFAEHWRNGLGAWLPSTQPYYMSALDVSWLLNQEYLQKFIGYTILVFQFTFLFFFAHRKLRPLFWVTGVSLHSGITLILNIYPFGLGMLVFYVLLVPFSWWRCLGRYLRPGQPLLTVYYDRDCPLCNRTVLTLNHFDLLHCIDFKDAQTYAHDCVQLSVIPPDTLLKDLYAVSGKGRVYSGLDTYIQILINMRYPALFGWLLKIPGIYHYAGARYRAIADTRARINCGTQCAPAYSLRLPSFYSAIFEPTESHAQLKNTRKITKIFIFLVFLQLNSSIHYGLVYRFDIDTRGNTAAQALSQASNALLMVSQTFVGITPHALYLHDHFEGYDKLLAITYVDPKGAEKWLPFVNQEGRLLAPHWGRVHSMWANIAVTPNINEARLKKFIMKITAFWGHRLHLDPAQTRFNIKLKANSAPSVWIHDLRNLNLHGTWQTIGTARWLDGQFVIHLPRDLEAHGA
ncbi:MAG: thiol-disulfide oxidoreductase [Gammaproteobacteria bacterium HGW-Gammaproteobacteria-3]|nr:MAG: thiol-disulfide oxidoreductase [Gammaproteobacteria bacterium HGW-Gammaproteobacteria-3]